MSDKQIRLSVQGVNKRFGGLQALSDVGLQIREGEIYGLIGPNGAGKTTFFNVITGLYTPDSGDFKLDGQNYTPTAVHQVAKAGIARTFQNIRLFGGMTALENVMVGRHVRTKHGLLGAVFRRRPSARKSARSRSARSSCSITWASAVRGLHVAQPVVRPPAPSRDRPRAGHRAEAARAGRAGGRHERDREGRTHAPARQDPLGRPHDPADRARREARDGLCNRMTVLDYGKVIAEGLPQDAEESEVIEAYLGAGVH
jgi:branched-chain amino acid transport system ATP-binding protein